MNVSKIRTATGRTAPNGTTSPHGRAPQRLQASISRKAARFTSRAACARIPGTTRPGQKKYMTEIIVNDLVMLTGKGEGAGGGEYSGSSRGASSGGNNFDQRTPEPEPAPAGPITDDDIPF